jgi:hypothetical protein
MVDIRSTKNIPDPILWLLNLQLQRQRCSRLPIAFLHQRKIIFIQKSAMLLHSGAINFNNANATDTYT